jgi:CRP/FNR family transcriptional regulator, anaerobic regulatory protein
MHYINYTTMLPLQAEAASKMLEFLNVIYPMSSGLQEEIMDLIQFKTLRKRQVLLKKGEVCRNIYFVTKGLLRLYYYTEEGGPQVSAWFMREGDICVSVHSYYNQVKSYEYIQAEEPCELIYIGYDQLEALYRKYLEFNFIGRVLTIKYMIDLHWQLRDIRYLKTDKRYNSLLNRDPALIQRVPAKYIASFLSMLPTSLSRTLDPKKKKKKKKS